MNEWMPACMVLCILLLTYLLHSTLAVAATYLLLNRLKWVTHPELRVLMWKLALGVPVISSLAVTIFEVPHFGVQVPISIVAASGATTEADADSLALTATGLSSEAFSGLAWSDVVGEADAEREAYLAAAREASAVPRAGVAWDSKSIAVMVIFVWWAAVVFGAIRLVVQMWNLWRLRSGASRVRVPEMASALARLQQRFGIRRRVTLLQSDQVQGPMTAGISRPFILLPAGVRWRDAAQRDALLAHELVHVARWDALWNLAIQILCRVFPFQVLNHFAGRQLRTQMDFVADAWATPTSEARLGLARSLMQFGDQLAAARLRPRHDSGLAACMASFDSMLGQRVECLLTEGGVRRPSSFAGRAAVVVLVTAAAVLAVTAVPRAVAQNPDATSSVKPSTLARKTLMHKPLSTLALLVGLTMPAAADEPQVKTAAQVQAKTDQPAQAAPLKTTPDPIPAGMIGFNGMLVGRLTAKDVEKGTFVVLVDAVPRVWRNSKSEEPKSVVGKAVEISGVFGRFLDVLVVTRPGETVEFECKHDGERLVFPGELLRKVAEYDPADYPEIPEAFRGFAGALTATIAKKDPETFEMIIEVDRVTDTWKGNKAKEPKSIEGKPLMLAGFWNRKDAYHGLKVGDKIEVGMQHIESRSDHLTVAEFVRKAGERSERPQPRREKEAETSAAAGGNQELRGFRGTLVGRLVKKDSERGTFTIAVDAVPRVWNNNQAANPKSLLGKEVTAEGVHGKMLDVLVVAKVGETIEFGALHDGGEHVRVGELLRKVAPVKPGDYPVLADGFRGFKGMVIAKVLRKDDQMMDMIVEVKDIKTSFAGSQAKDAESMVGQQATIAGFWKRKEAFHGLNVGDLIECGLEHPQYLSDHLSVIEGIKKVEAQ